MPVLLAQESYTTLSNRLNELAKSKPELQETVRVDLSGLTLYDFITTLAEEHKINVSVSTDLNEIVRSNFFDLNIKDVFLFLVKKYDLEVEIINNIIVFKKKPQEVFIEPPKPPKKIDVTYNELNDFLSVKLRNDSLPRVAKAITDVSGKNIVLSPDVKTDLISAYILNRPFDQVLDLMAKSNNLSFVKDEDNNYYFQRGTGNTIESSSVNNKRNLNFSQNNNQTNTGFQIQKNKNGFLDVIAYNANVASVIKEAARELNVNYFMYDSPENIQATLEAKGLTFDMLLTHLFKGEKFTYKNIDNLYLIGEHQTQGLRYTELIQLENRTIETVLNTLPKAVVQDVDIKEFSELNGFVVSGSKINIKEFKDYIREIDRVVPVIQIEVIIVQYQKSYEIQTGIQAGIDNKERTTSGQLFPSTNMNLNSSSVNNLIDAFNGLGIVNLGKVTQQFYLNLQALENNSLINVSSTPKLVTLNGHEASSSLGETNYYFEQNNRLINSGINDNILQSGTWKATEANLSINIKPLVSKDENVTLTVSVEKSSFLGRAGENAPPGKSTQKFESMIRVKNNEMVLLGGLDELDNENSGTGTPLLSRIPIIKWFFSSRSKRKEKSKLHIFIKPTVIY